MAGYLLLDWIFLLRAPSVCALPASRDMCRPPPRVSGYEPTGSAHGLEEELVTFVIPTKRRLTLTRTLRSLRRQTDPGWLAIVVCDGCDESVHAVVEREVLGDRRVSVIRSGQKLGTGTNSAGLVRNVGIDRVTTPWVAFVDDDDTVTANYVLYLRTDVQRHTGVKAVIFRMLTRDDVILPPAHHDTFMATCVGISFALDMEFLRSNRLWFVPSNVEVR